MKDTQKSAKSTTAIDKKFEGFTDEERGAMNQRASPLAETLVRDARVCQGRQGRLLLPKRAEVQHQVRDVRLQRQGEPRRRRHVADRLRSDGVDRRRRGKDRRAREESGELRTEQATGPRPRTCFVTGVACR